MSERPSVVVLGGPNGSGKSTAAVRLLRDSLEIMEFVNADAIAKGLSPFNPEGVAIHSGRLMLERLKELAGRAESFAFETTLASRTFGPWLSRLKLQQGYHVRIVFVWLQSPELNIERVARRVKLGGHSIPDHVIQRRYYRSVRNCSKSTCGSRLNGRSMAIRRLAHCGWLPRGSRWQRLQSATAVCGSC